MKNRYLVLKEIELTKLVGLNIIPIHLMDWLVIYEYYCEERKSLGKMQSYSNTAENYKLSESHIMNVVSWMESN
jgi:hypothetical protein